MLNGMTNTVAMSRTGDWYRNIDSIENKCAELISQIDDHLCVSDRRSLINRNDPENEPIQNAEPIFLCCHQSIVDYSSTRKPSHDIRNLPKLRIAKEFCDKMTKINQPLPEDLKSFLKPASMASTKTIKSTHSKPALKKQVAFNLNVEPELGCRNDGNVAVFGCSHYSPTHWQNQHKCLASTKHSHAHPESVIDSQPHVQNGVWPPGNSTADLRAFLFGSSKKDGRIPKATKNTIVSVKTKRELRKKLRWPQKLKQDEVFRGKSRRKVHFKIDKPITEHVTNGIPDEAVTIMPSVSNMDEKSLENRRISKNQNKYFEDEKMKLKEIQNEWKIGEVSPQHQPMDDITERKLATQLLKDSMKFCLKNTTRKEKKISFSLSS